eukprot:726525-Pyramimonas_sp.AAC.1
MKEFQAEVGRMTADARDDRRCLFYDWMVDDQAHAAGCRMVHLHHTHHTHHTPSAIVTYAECNCNIH